MISNYSSSLRLAKWGILYPKLVRSGAEINAQVHRCLSSSTTRTTAKDSIRIGCASGFWGDTPTADSQQNRLAYGVRKCSPGASNVDVIDYIVSQLVNHGKLDFLVLDYLSEITMSLLVGAQAKSKDLGWCPDFAHTVGPLLGQIKKKGIKVVTNAGGINSMACMATMSSIAEKVGAEGLKIAVVLGDDVLHSKDKITTDQCPDPTSITSMNAYLGAGPISRALDLGADMVICGRCTDSALALGPLIHSFNWSWSDFDRISAGSLAGHLIECGAQSTGGICTQWQSVAGWENTGFPIAVCDRKGNTLITKPDQTGGLVNRCTVSEQLLYEVHDPAAYVLPDSICDFSQVKLTEEIDGVLVTGAKGLPPTPSYKIGGTYQDGWKSTTVCPVVGPKAVEKSVKTADAIIRRCQGIYKFLKLPDFTQTYVHVIGSEQAYGPNARAANIDTREAALWISVLHKEKVALEIFAREIASAGTGMAPGLTTVVGGRPKTTPVLKFFSYLQPKDELSISIQTSDGHKEIYQPEIVQTTNSMEGIGSTSPLTATAADSSAGKAGGSYKVGDLAWTRSGDKGDACNIAVIAKDPAQYPLLMSLLTPDKVSNYFAHKATPGKELKCTRYQVPGVHGLNFVLENSLGGGGIASINIDPQGKGYGQMILDLEL